MKYIKTALAGLVLMASGLANASLINYDLVLTADSDYTAFGGGQAGDQFFGTFSIDDSLLPSPLDAPSFITDFGEPGDPNGLDITGSSLFINVDIAGIIFSDVTTQLHSNILRFVDGELADISFLLANSNSDSFGVRTFNENGFVEWFATEYAQGPAPIQAIEGNTFGFSVAFNLANDNGNGSNDVPEPSTLAIFALGLIGLASRRRFKKQ